MTDSLHSGDGVSRRSILGSLATLAAATALPARGATGDAKPFKFCVFADMHHSPGAWPNDEMSFLDRILERAEREECSLLFQLGDFVPAVGSQKLAEYVRHFNASKVPAFHLLGNHDCDYSPRTATCEAYNLERGYYALDRGGWRFIVCDPNYMLVKGAYIPYERENSQHCPKDAPFNLLPPDQMAWLRETVMDSPHPCVIMSHESFERPMSASGVGNGEEVLKLIREANERHPGRVRLVMCGHYHVGHMSMIGNVPFWEVNGANFYSNGFRHKLYPADYLKTHVLADRVLARKDPLSAVVSLYPDGRIRIDGSKSEWLFGVLPEQIGQKRFDDCGRRASAEIENFDMTVDWMKACG